MAKCQICQNEDELQEYEVSTADDNLEYEKTIQICPICASGIDGDIDENHWRCLNDSMWSEIPAVKVVSYRILKKLKNQDLLEMMYLEDDILAWADDEISSDDEVVTKDTNGVVLSKGDSISIIKDLEVKGAGFTAKRGTIVKHISLTSNSEQIEGKVNGTKIVLLTKFIKKV